MILWGEEQHKNLLFGVQCGGYLGRGGQNDVVMKVKKADQHVAPQMTRYRKFYVWLGAEIGRQEGDHTLHG